MMACATAVIPDLTGPMPEGSSPIKTGGSGGELASAGAGDDTNGGNAGASVAGTASGGSGQGSNAGAGGKSANGGGGTGGVGKGGTGSGGTSSGGTSSGGKGGAGGSGKGGAGGSATGGSATGGSATGGSATGGSATGGSGPGGGGTGGGGVNLITNSGFETNTSGWSVFGGAATIARSTAQAHSGTQSLVITGRTQPYQGPQYSVLSVATPLTSYSLSLWGRLASSNATGSLTVTLHYSCSGGSSAAENYFTWVATAAASATSWTEFSGVQTFPACAGGGTMSAASIYVESPTATLSYYIDDIVFTTP